MYTDRARNKFLNVAYYRWKWPILRLYKVSKARSSHPFPEESICKEIKFYFPLLNSILSPYVSRYSNSNRFDYYGIDGPFSSSSTYRQIFVFIEGWDSVSRDTRTLFRGKVQSPANLGWCRGRRGEEQRNRIGELDETFPFRLNWRLRD